MKKEDERVVKRRSIGQDVKKEDERLGKGRRLTKEM